MEIRREDQGSVSVYYLTGEMDLYCSGEVKDRVRESLDEGIRQIILECSELSYIDSSGIGVLISLLTTLRKSRGSLILCRLQQSVYSVINFTKLSGFLVITDTLDEALGNLIVEVQAEQEKAKYEIKGIVRDSGHPLLSTEGMYHKEFNLDLRRVRRLSQLILQKAPAEIREVNLLEQQVSEIIKNAVRHGNKNDPNKKIKVWFSFGSDHAHVIVKDEGSGFRNVDHWNRFYEKKMKAFAEKDFDTMMDYLSYRTENSTEADGGNALMAAVEFWNKGVVISDKGNTFAVRREYTA